MNHRRTLFSFALVVFASIAAQSSAYAAHDLTPDLRSEVDVLKAFARSENTTPENALARVEVLWRWANAIALQREHLPINLSLFVRSVMMADSPRALNPMVLSSIDRYIYELGLRDDHPGAVGEVRVDAPDVIPARSYQTITVTYSVGSVPMVEGGRIMLARQFMSDGAPLQRNDPSADGYVSIESSNSSAQWEQETVPWYGAHGGFRAPIPVWTYRLSGTTLEEGDSISLTYGDTSGGARGMEIQTFSNDATPLPIYVDLENSEHFLSLPLPTFRVVGTDMVAVHGIAPSIVAPGESFQLRVRPEDYYFNLATGPVPAIEVLLNGESYRQIPAGASSLSKLDVSLDQPGVYQFSFASEDGRVLGRSNPVWVRENPPYRIYWGETHGHSGFAEGQGTVDGYFEFGRDEAGLDFLTLSEHDLWLDDHEWNVINDATNKFSVENEFIVFPGYEWSAPRARGGHHNVFFRRPGRKRVSTHRAPELSQLYQQLRAENDLEDVLIIPHAHQLADWRLTDVDAEQLIEIMSSHGTFEWFGQRYLQQGHRVGFVGASDDHLGHPGYSPGRGYGARRSNIGQFGGLAAATAPEKTTDAIFDALRARSAYATSHSQRIILDTTFNGERMGRQLPYKDAVVIEGRVIGTNSIDTIDIISNGEVVWSKNVAKKGLSKRVSAHLSFWSESTSYIRDTPRGFRIWEGSVEVKGGTLEGFTTVEKLNRSVDFVRISEDDSNRIDFSVATRGVVNNIVLEISGATPNTVVEVTLDETTEGGRAPVQVRNVDTFPASKNSFTLQDAVRENAVKMFQTDRFTDEVALRIVDYDSSIDHSFRFKATEPPTRGDYYYVRVRQLDGAMAWSSPVWIGGEPSR